MCPIMRGDAKLGHGELRAQETNLASSRTLLETPRPSTDHGDTVNIFRVKFRTPCLIMEGLLPLSLKGPISGRLRGFISPLRYLLE